MATGISRGQQRKLYLATAAFTYGSANTNVAASTGYQTGEADLSASQAAAIAVSTNRLMGYVTKGGGGSTTGTTETVPEQGEEVPYPQGSTAGGFAPVTVTANVYYDDAVSATGLNAVTNRAVQAPRNTAAIVLEEITAKTRGGDDLDKVVYRVHRGTIADTGDISSPTTGPDVLTLGLAPTRAVQHVRAS